MASILPGLLITLFILAAILIAAIKIATILIFFRPNSGLFIQWQNARQRARRILKEDALKYLFHNENGPTIQSISEALRLTEQEADSLVSAILEEELAVWKGIGLRLTSSGRLAALKTLRAHRLWERYLADKTGFSEAEWHARADRAEHILSASDADALSAQLSHPTYDPHGDPIPSASGEMAKLHALPLTAADIHGSFEIVHLEDEPPSIYAQLVAEELHPGMILDISERTQQQIHFWTNGDEHHLATDVAANIYVLPLPDKRTVRDIPKLRLADLEPGQSGTVVTLSPACRGLERRRMMDLGILPGTVIRAEFVSAGGDPVAYRIREALIALREEQARLITIQSLEKNHAI